MMRDPFGKKADIQISPEFRKPWFMERKDGLTMVELLIVIALIGILSSVAVPSIPKWQLRMTMQKDSRDVLSALNIARMKAITVKKTVTFNLDEAGKSYQVYDTDGMVYLRGSVNKKISFTDNTLGTSVDFNTRGMPTSSGSFRLSSSLSHKTVTLYVTGVSKIQ